MLGGGGVQNELILYDGRAHLQPTSPLVDVVLSGIHDLAHEGNQKTIERVRRGFYWKGWKKTIQDYIRNCVVCQRNKWETLQPAGLLQPLPIPTAIWADISMDFVEALPKVSGKSVLLVVVDRFSKYAHFIPLGHPYTAESVARVFFSEIFRLHGLPETIVSDKKGMVVPRTFFQKLFLVFSKKIVLCYKIVMDGKYGKVYRRRPKKDQAMDEE